MNETEGYPLEDQVVFYAGKPLDGSIQLGTLPDLATVNVELRLVGGKLMHATVIVALPFNSLCFTLESGREFLIRPDQTYVNYVVK